MPSKHDEFHRQRALIWYQRLGFPNRETLTKTALCSEGFDITEDDIGLLPWDSRGEKIDMIALKAMSTEATPRAAQQAQDADGSDNNVCNHPKCSKTKSSVYGGKLSLCKRCGFAKYCGPECQTSDWKVHKRICGRGQRKITQDHIEEYGHQQL